MSLLTVDTDLCTQCGACRAECPVGIILEKKDGTPALMKGAGPHCLDCGHCVAVCPVKAISLETMAPGELDRPDKSLRIGAEAGLQFLKTRRSVRVFKDKPVEPQDIAEIIDAARFAPSAHNRQPVHWTVVPGRDKVGALSQMIVDWLDAENRMRGVVAWWKRGRDMILHQAPVIVAAHALDTGDAARWSVTDCAVAAEYAELAAHAKGLGTCWAGFLILAASHHPQMREHLGLPEGHGLHAALMLGHAKHRFQRIPRRTPARIDWR